MTVLSDTGIFVGRISACAIRHRSVSDRRSFIARRALAAWGCVGGLRFAYPPYERGVA